MIGTCAYKGKPDANGMVEIGYEIIPDYRLQGYATEAALALINHAFQFPGIQKIYDPEDGNIWQWCKKKQGIN